MSTIEYSDGTKIEFSGSPTQQDVEEAYNKVKGINVQSSNIPNTIQDNSGLQGVAQGIAKGEVSTIKGLSDFGERFAGQTVGRVLNLIRGKGFTPTEFQSPIESVIGKDITSQLTVPTSTAENVGFGIEKIAEFLAPTGTLNKVSTAGQSLIKGTGIISKVLKTGVKLGTEFVGAGTVSTAQQGEINDKVKTDALVAGLFSGIGSAISTGTSLFSKATNKIGSKIQSVVIKPSSSDIADGFKIENIKKYNLGGSLEQTLSKTSNELNNLSSQLNNKLKSSNLSINLNKIFDETVSDLSGAKAKNFGNIQGTQRVLQSLKNEITEVAGSNGLVSVPEAQLVKQGAGTKGSWVFGSGDPDATSIEKVYNAFYKRLKVSIENNSPEGVKEINKQISELIPIQNAVLRRIPIENRNSILSHTDSISLFGSLFNPKALALLGASRLSRSGKFGNFLVNLSDKIKTPQKSQIGRRLFGQENISSANTNQIKQNIKNPTNPNINIR